MTFCKFGGSLQAEPVNAMPAEAISKSVVANDTNPLFSDSRSQVASITTYNGLDKTAFFNRDLPKRLILAHTLETGIIATATDTTPISDVRVASNTAYSASSGMFTNSIAVSTAISTDFNSTSENVWASNTTLNSSSSLIVTPSSGANGTISPNTPQTVNNNGSISFTATPATGYTVDTWKLDGNNVQTFGTGYTLSNVTANHTVSVSFASTVLPGSYLKYYSSSIDDSLQPYGIYIPTSYYNISLHPVIFIGHGFKGHASSSFSVNQKAFADTNGFLLVQLEGRGNCFYDGVGEVDFLDVLSLLRVNYTLNEDCLYFEGASMGATGAYREGIRHPELLAAVGGVDGFGDYRFWYTQYYGPASTPDYVEPFRLPNVLMASCVDIAENAKWQNIYMNVHSGDTSVLPPNTYNLNSRLTALGNNTTEQDYIHEMHEYPGGHISSYDQIALYNYFKTKSRLLYPSHVICKTTQLKNGRTHWVSIDRMHTTNTFATLEATIASDTITVAASNVLQYTLYLSDNLVNTSHITTIVTNGVTSASFSGSAVPVTIYATLNSLGNIIGWSTTNSLPVSLRKTATIEGPIGHAYTSRFIVAYGSDPADKIEADRFCTQWNSWMNSSITARPDTSVTDSDRASCNLILFGTADSNSVILAIQPSLPIIVQNTGVTIGSKSYTGSNYGTYFVYPNPSNQEKYIVISHKIIPGSREKDLEALPWYWPDYVIFDTDKAAGACIQSSLAYLPSSFVAAGYFDAYWNLPNFLVTPSSDANGTISPNTAQTVNYNGNISFTATPITGYTVDTWTLDGNNAQTGGTGYTLSNVTANHTVSVNFKHLEPTITSFTPVSGSMGTVITISGTNFIGVTAVEINGIAMTTFTVNSETSIAATVPTGPSTGSIAITTAGGTVTSIDNFIIYHPPTDITLSVNTIAENAAIGTTIGTLTATDPDASDTHTFTLISGTGSTHNSFFNIVNDKLEVKSSLNYESKPVMYIRVKATDQNGTGLSYEKALTITITNVNESPFGITLSNSVVAANEPIGTVVGTLSTSDPDAGDYFTYSFEDDVNYPDNLLFTLNDNVLKTGQIFDYNDGTSYNINIKTTDAIGYSFDKIFMITISQPLFQQPVLEIKGPNDDSFKTESSASVLTSATYHLLLKNTDTVPDTFVLNGPAGENGWTIKYFTEGGSPAEITNDITNPDGYSIDVTNPSTTTIRMEVTATYTVMGGTSFEAVITAVSSNNVDAIDMVVATTTKLPVQSVTITSPTVSPIIANTPVTFTVNVTGDVPVKYKFMDGATMLRDYAISNTYTWTSTTGNHTITAVAREIGTTTEIASNDLTYDVIGTLSAVSMTTSPANTAAFGTPVTLTATATGGKNIQYKFMNDTVVIRNFNSSNSVVWTPALKKTYDKLTVIAKDLDGIDPTATVVSNPVTLVTKTALSSVTINANNTSPSVGSTVTFTATATGGASIQYQFLLDGNTTTPLRDFAASNTCEWTATAGTHTITVIARDINGNSGATVTANKTLTVKTALASVSMVTSPSNTVKFGTLVTLTATATGGVNVQYKFMNGTTIIRNFASSNSCTWTPAYKKTYNNLTVVAKDLGGIDPNATKTSDPVTLVVTP